MKTRYCIYRWNGLAAIVYGRKWTFPCYADFKPICRHKTERMNQYISWGLIDTIYTSTTDEYDNRVDIIDITEDQKKSLESLYKTIPRACKTIGGEMQLKDGYTVYSKLKFVSIQAIMDEDEFSYLRHIARVIL